MPKEIYLDYNATTPVLQEVIGVIEDTLENFWGNPSSAHRIGKTAKDVLEQARLQVANIIGAKSNEIIFTSGGTESNNLAIIGAVRKYAHRGKHLITTRIEHPSVLNPFIYLMEQGFEVDFISPKEDGTIDPKDIESAIKRDTIFCSVMLANNETGAIQPISQIGKICKKHNIIFHTDAAQAVGKIQVDVEKLEVDLLTIAGHKIYAPKGIGALFVKEGVQLESILFGAGQENGLRPGTEPVPLACGLGEACRFLKDKVSAFSNKLTELKQLLFELLKKENKDIVKFVPDELSLPNTLFVAIPGTIGAQVLEKAKGVFASTGAACHDRSIKVSHVLSAMNVDEHIAKGAIRLSLGILTNEKEIRDAAQRLNMAIKELNKT